MIEYELPELWTPDGERILAENIFLCIRGSEKICITGKNGVGKTTLLHKIAEELLNRNDIHAEYMPQNYEELLQLHVTPCGIFRSDREKRGADKNQDIFWAR